MRDHWGTAQYRIRLPLLQLAQSGHIRDPVFHVVKDDGFDLDRTLDSRNEIHVIVQPFLSDEGLTMMEQLARRPHLNITLAVDDLWTGLPGYNPVRNSMPLDVADRLAYAATLSHQLVATTAALAHRLGLRHPNLSVVENALPHQPWTDLAEPENCASGGRPRFGWAGAKQHQFDLEFLEPVIAETSKDIDWVFFGMCPDQLRPHVKEIHELKPFVDYPATLAGMHLDVAIAPLVDNPFNRCKSHLKILEYGVLGWPVIASALDPYAQAPVKRIEGCDTQAWLKAVRELANDPGERAKSGQQLRDWVGQHHMLESRMSNWCNALGLHARAG